MNPESSPTSSTTSNTGAKDTSPPSLIWIIVPLVIVILTGALVAILYRVLMRCRHRKKEGDPERAAAPPEPVTEEVGDAPVGGGPGPGPGPGPAPASLHGTRRHTMPDPPQPADRWGWVFDPNSSRGAARSTEGLNELGEAPPPYGEDSERPKSRVAEMAEVRDAGEGPSGAAPWQQRRGPQGLAEHRRSTGSEPPAYELAVGAGEGEASPIREPPAAVIARPQ